MKELLELAEKIEDKELRKKVIDLIKHPSLSHKDFKKYPAGKIEKVKTPFSVGGATVERELLKHTVALTEICRQTAESLEKNFGLKINHDYLLAGALVHDLMKIFEWKTSQQGTQHTGVLLDHSMLGVAELYKRGFPETVIHIVASHFGEGSPTPPRNYEALIVHYIDTMLSLAEFHMNEGKPPATPVIYLGDDVMKQLGEKSEE